jgi:hypothetical protein
MEEFRSTAHELVEAIAAHVGALPEQPVWQAVPDGLCAETVATPRWLMNHPDAARDATEVRRAPLHPPEQPLRRGRRARQPRWTRTRHPHRCRIACPTRFTTEPPEGPEDAVTPMPRPDPRFRTNSRPTPIQSEKLTNAAHQNASRAGRVFRDPPRYESLCQPLEAVRAPDVDLYAFGLESAERD